MKSPITLFLLLVCFLSTTAQTPTPVIVGAMKNVMWKGELAGSIKLDTLTHKSGLYGLGPIEYLRGELLILDGITYASSVIDENKMKVFVASNLSAPFFAYGNVTKWSVIDMPSTISDLDQLEKFLNDRFKDLETPFFFKLEGLIDSAEVHIVNLPAGTVVKSPTDAHQGQTNYKLYQRNATLIGFFSRKHQAIFTHLDTFIHIHLITEEKDMMGHLESVFFSNTKMKLLLPEPLH